MCYNFRMEKSNELDKSKSITVTEATGPWDGSEEDTQALKSWDKDLKTGDGAIKAQRPFDLKAI